MTKVIIMSDTDIELQSYYEGRLQYLHHKYHNHPSNLIPGTERHAARGSGHTSAHGDEYYSLPAGFNCGKDVA